jgi:2-hydroxy-6-oxonona-2,4-dienedioate hydrolase
MIAADVPRAVLLGNSMGCQVVASVAERAAGIILTSPTIDPGRRSGPQQIGRWLVDGTREKGSLGVIQLRDYWRAGPSRVLQAYGVMMRDRIEERLPRIQAPALVVRGGRDPIVPQDWAEEAARLLPHGRLVVIPGAPHALNYSAPLELARVIRPFLHELSAPASSAKPKPG